MELYDEMQVSVEISVDEPALKRPIFEGTVVGGSGPVSS
jgi:hypothetical protein